MTSMLRFCHPATNRFEDLRPAEFGNQQSECVPAGCSVQLDITARSRPPFDDSGQLKFPQRTNHRGSRCAECFHEFRLARKPLAWFILARCDCIGKGLPDFFVLRQRRSSRGFGNHRPDNTGRVYWPQHKISLDNKQTLQIYSSIHNNKLNQICVIC